MDVQPEVVCTVNKDAEIGDEFPVSLKLPEQVSFDNFDLSVLYQMLPNLSWRPILILR